MRAVFLRPAKVPVLQLGFDPKVPTRISDPTDPMGVWACLERPRQVWSGSKAPVRVKRAGRGDRIPPRAASLAAERSFMRPTLRTLAPLTLALAAASSQAAGPFDGPYGVRSWTYEYNGTLAGQFDGGARSLTTETYGTGSYEDSLDGISAAGDAHAHANLALGTVGAATAGTGGVTRGINRAFYTEAHARLWDTVVISGIDASAITIPIQFALDGFAHASGNTDSYAEFKFWVYDLDYGTTVLNGDTYAYGNTVLNAAIPNGNTLIYNGDRHLQIGYELVTHSSLYFDEPGGLDTGANFYNTLHFRWDLPSEITLGDASPYGGSNLFRPGPTQPVPEPASFGALAIGATALLRRRRRTE